METDGLIQAVFLLLAFGFGILVFNKSLLWSLNVMIPFDRQKDQLHIILHLKSLVMLHHFIVELHNDESLEAMLEHGDDSR